MIYWSREVVIKMVLEKRDLAKMIILTIVTCGIYGIYWLVMLGKDACHVKDVKDEGALEIVLMIFLPFIGFYLAEKKLAEGCQAKGITHTDNSVLYLILGLFGFAFIDTILLQSELNKIADAKIDIAGNAYYQQNQYQQYPPQQQYPQQQYPQQQYPQQQYQQRPQQQYPQQQYPQQQRPQQQNPNNSNNGN